ncbi:MAG TPA: alpha/beta hydrolase [Pyrinomonadaceae bacterium]|nr:alpha/beta hydrolase [Pyrinomonadaceae bacterium]
MKKKNLALGIGGAIGGLIAWKMLSRAKEVAWDDVSDKIVHTENSHFTEVDGARVHYQEFGEAGNNPTLLLIHGYPASTFVWHIVAPVFAERGFHVVAVDLLGFGFSDKPSWFDYSIASQAQMIRRFMDRLGIGRATIIGSSYGGAVASTVALDYAERVEKLVLVGTIINDDAKKQLLLKLATIPGVGEILSPFLIDSKRFLKRRMRGTLCSSNHHLITPERVEGIQRPLRAANAHRSVLATARKWDAGRIERDAYLINHPTLILWGEHDKVVPIHNGEKIHESILNSRFVVFKDCGHVPQEEAPNNFVEVIGEFCRSSKGKFEIKESGEMQFID